MRVWLQNARTEKNLTMKEMSAKLGISESYYCSIENGTRQKKMEIGLAVAISVILGMSVETIAQHESEWAKRAEQATG